MSNAPISIEKTDEKMTGTCSCCGHESRCVWGLASEGDTAVAAYYVHWTPGHVGDRGANLDLIVGTWGENAHSNDRSAVALAYRLTETGPAFMVIDAKDRPVADSTLVGYALDRDEVIGFPIAERAFAIADEVLAGDDRIVELLGGVVRERRDRSIVPNWFAKPWKRKPLR